MNSGTLFVSFWNISLDNIPEGSFTHRRIAPSDAAIQIGFAHREKRLMCVSRKDLVAPFSEREREQHEELCAVLKKHFGISLQLSDFMNLWEEDGVRRYTIDPLIFAEVNGANRLLVVNCSYTMKEETVDYYASFRDSSHIGGVQPV